MRYDFDNMLQMIYKGKYRLLGNGSSRRVFDLENGFVVKVAKDLRGIHQNNAEYTVYKKNKSGMFAHIEAVSEDFRLLIMTKAQKIKSMDIVFQYYKVRNSQALFRLEGFVDDITLYDLGKGDLKRSANWGLIDGVPKIIDYGLTKEIYQKYYSRKLLLFRNKKHLAIKDITA